MYLYDLTSMFNLYMKMKVQSGLLVQARIKTKFSGGVKQIWGGALYINVLNINAIFNLFTLTSH